MLGPTPYPSIISIHRSLSIASYAFLEINEDPVERTLLKIRVLLDQLGFNAGCPASPPLLGPIARPQIEFSAVDLFSRERSPTSTGGPRACYRRRGKLSDGGSSLSTLAGTAPSASALVG
ncbi:hypothetical protein THAOC_09930 [Thalassiosira oceanica]|uniref:Uncharacterized protein n=1 Tax=Thalassiosira oceanica TaxID=159749 RepID=K0SV76_THAOC|nr:hypothetical protein THAOC_09930 [Thalassiosira oceanica]|eukprot:EJK68859.1 hypothetical protein THAOC_09930 [Thalassiosira oceanica]